ncbi:uncharacterized protein L199_007816 [Kwoniella botswanensis]|uniref:uncharacterized protein n=1 Tax=Kwoniella botswanensis TaxID=1268659 RepID=UPI00315DBF4F
MSSQVGKDKSLQHTLFSSDEEGEDVGEKAVVFKRNRQDFENWNMKGYPTTSASGIGEIIEFSWMVSQALDERIAQKQYKNPSVVDLRPLLGDCSNANCMLSKANQDPLGHRSARTKDAIFTNLHSEGRSSLFNNLYHYGAPYCDDHLPSSMKNFTWQNSLKPTDLVRCSGTFGRRVIPEFLNSSGMPENNSRLVGCPSWVPKTTRDGGKWPLNVPYAGPGGTPDEKHDQFVCSFRCAFDCLTKTDQDNTKVRIDQDGKLITKPPKRRSVKSTTAASASGSSTGVPTVVPRPSTSNVEIPAPDRMITDLTHDHWTDGPIGQVYADYIPPPQDHSYSQIEPSFLQKGNTHEGRVDWLKSEQAKMVEQNNNKYGLYLESEFRYLQFKSENPDFTRTDEGCYYSKCPSKISRIVGKEHLWQFNVKTTDGQLKGTCSHEHQAEAMVEEMGRQSFEDRFKSFLQVQRSSTGTGNASAPVNPFFRDTDAGGFNGLPQYTSSYTASPIESHAGFETPKRRRTGGSLRSDSGDYPADEYAMSHTGSATGSFFPPSSSMGPPRI